MNNSPSTPASIAAAKRAGEANITMALTGDQVAWLWHATTAAATTADAETARDLTRLALVISEGAKLFLAARPVSEFR